MSVFTPWSAAIGGALIAASAVLLLATLGRVAGISGIVGRLPTAAPGDRAWRWAFLLGLLAGAGLWARLAGVPPPGAISGPSLGPWGLAAAGALVGCGTALAGGCTSGHGVCGLARLSRRSFAAVGVFMAVALLTTWGLRHGGL